jgi:hypothetical protein
VVRRTCLAAPSVEGCEEARRWALSERHSINVSTRHWRQLPSSNSAQQVRRSSLAAGKDDDDVPGCSFLATLSKKVALRTPELRMFTPPVLDTAAITSTHPHTQWPLRYPLPAPCALSAPRSHRTPATPSRCATRHSCADRSGPTPSHSSSSSPTAPPSHCAPQTLSRFSRARRTSETTRCGTPPARACAT